MFAGHYSAAFAGKGLDQQIPLWVLFVAVQLVDVFWSLFIILGVEHVRIVPGFMAGSPLDLYYMPYTHSLLATFVWGALTYAVCRLWPALRGRKKAAVIVALAVMSHWLLDLLVHTRDLPLYDNSMKMGFGLWNYPLIENGLEIGLLFATLAFCLRTATGITPKRRKAMIALVIGLCVFQAMNFFMPPPPSANIMAMMALGSYVILATLAWWVERERKVAAA